MHCAGDARIKSAHDEAGLSPQRQTFTCLLASGQTVITAGANDVTEAQMVDALGLAHEEIKKLVALQEELYRELAPEA